MRLLNAVFSLNSQQNVTVIKIKDSVTEKTLLKADQKYLPSLFDPFHWAFLNIFLDNTTPLNMSKAIVS